MAADVLLLVPTREERELLDRAGTFPSRVERCGLGPVAAAAVTTRWLQGNHCGGVLLLGLAGTFWPEQVPLGRAVEITEVLLDGVGVGTDTLRRAPSDLGWNLVPGSVKPEAGGLDERLALSEGTGTESALALTVCAASATLSDAKERRLRFPEALVEEMEGFGVALACRLAGIPLRIVRGVSNEAGDRDVAGWQTTAAMVAARELALEILTSWELRA